MFSVASRPRTQGHSPIKTENIQLASAWSLSDCSDMPSYVHICLVNCLIAVICQVTFTSARSIAWWQWHAQLRSHLPGQLPDCSDMPSYVNICPVNCLIPVTCPVTLTSAWSIVLLQGHAFCLHDPLVFMPNGQGIKQFSLVQAKNVVSCLLCSTVILPWLPFGNFWYRSENHHWHAGELTEWVHNTCSAYWNLCNAFEKEITVWQRPAKACILFLK